jgi:hypothetical protein
MKRSRDEEDGIVGFGKHAEKTHEYVMKNHQGYCDWVLKQDSTCHDKMREFQEYLLRHKGLLVESRTNIFNSGTTWSPRHHYLFPACFRKSVRTFLLCLNRMNVWLPKDLLGLVILQAVDKDGNNYKVGFGKNQNLFYYEVPKKYVKWVLSKDREELSARSMLNFYDYCFARRESVDDDFMSDSDDYYM